MTSVDGILSPGNRALDNLICICNASQQPERRTYLLSPAVADSGCTYGTLHADWMARSADLGRECSVPAAQIAAASTERSSGTSEAYLRFSRPRTSTIRRFSSPSNSKPTREPRSS